MPIKEWIKRLFESDTQRIIRISTEPYICRQCGKLGSYATLEDREAALYGGSLNLICPNGHKFNTRDPLKPTIELLGRRK